MKSIVVYQQNATKQSAQYNTQTTLLHIPRKTGTSPSDSPLPFTYMSANT